MLNQRHSLGLNSMVVVVVLGLVAGCSTSKNVREVKEAYELQKPVVVQTSKDDERPDWTKKTVFEEDGKVYFSGGFLNGSDYAVTVWCANAEAMKAVVQSISQYVRAEFSEYAHGPNSPDSGTDRYVEDGIATLAENVHVQGVRQKELYYEEVLAPSVMRRAYNIFVMIEMSRADYLKAKADVLQKLRDRLSSTGEIEAKRKAERLLEDLKEELRAERGA
jgi:hypothetical protein